MVGIRSIRFPGIKSWRSWFVIAILCSVTPLGPGAAMEVDLELVLAVDVSPSIDAGEATRQRKGYLAALGHPAVIEAIRDGPLGRIAVTYVEWAGQSFQRKVVDWRPIGDQESVNAFLEALAGKSIASAPSTSISGLIDFARGEFRVNRYTGARKVIDVSGDGPNSGGRPVWEARDDAISEGITINGLPILSTRPDPDGGAPAAFVDWHYEQKVIGGPGAFLMVANDFESFAPILVRKLIRELRGETPVARVEHGPTALAAPCLPMASVRGWTCARPIRTK